MTEVSGTKPPSGRCDMAESKRTEYRYRDHLIIGDARQVAAALTLAQRRGELVGTARPIPLGDGRVRVAVRLREPVPAVRAPKPSRRPHAIAGALAAGAVVLAAIVAVALWVLAHLVVIVGAAVVVALGGWFGLGQVGACPGLHCPGCRCGGTR